MIERKQEDELYISWKGNKLNKIFTINCRCGANKFLKAQNGVRCINCGLFHSYTAWEVKKKEIKKERKWNGIRDKGEDTRAIDVKTIKRKPKLINGKVVWQYLGTQRDSDLSEERISFISASGKKLI